MEKIFAITAALFIIFATAGFLLVTQLFESKIKRNAEDNIASISKQMEIARLIEKANSYREAAMMTSDSIEVLKALKARDDIIQKREEVHLQYHRYSATYVLNALLAAKQLGSQEGDDLLKTIVGLKIDDLKDFYRNYVKKAADATFTLQKSIDDNKRKIGSLEKTKSFLWYVCFGFQSLGMIFGLIALFIKKFN